MTAAEQLIVLPEERWAILWHDAVHEPKRSDNEERSAELARRELLDCGVAEADASEVARLIVLTKGHGAKEGDRLGALMTSIFLSILGADSRSYCAYAAGVRREYAHVPDDAWRKGRSTVLKALRAHDPIYTDQEFRDRFEAQARRNIEEELGRLSSA